MYPEAALNPGISPSRKDEATSSCAFKVSCTCNRDVRCLVLYTVKALLSGPYALALRLHPGLPGPNVLTTGPYIPRDALTQGRASHQSGGDCVVFAHSVSRRFCFICAPILTIDHGDWLLPRLSAIDIGYCLQIIGYWLLLLGVGHSYWLLTLAIGSLWWKLVSLATSTWPL